MWQRQIQCLPWSCAPFFMPTGWGSWTITKSHSPSRLLAFISL